MALVDYDSSSEIEDAVSDDALSVSEAGSQQAKGLKRKNEAEHELPPLPSKFHDLYASNVRTTTYDDPALHGGRKRIKPHVEGNWPTHLYVEWWPRARDLEVLSSLITSFPSAFGISNVKIESLLESQLGAPLPLHISLSRSLTLTLSNKAPFLSRVQSAISTSSISSFAIKPEKCTWVPNYEKTRWFLVLSVARPAGDQLNNLLQACNSVAAEFDQPPLYDSPSFNATTPVFTAADTDNDKEFDRSSAFHISIAWTLTPPPPSLIEAAQSWSNNQISPFEVKDMKAKIGNVVTSIPLKPEKAAQVEKKSFFSV